MAQRMDFTDNSSHPSSVYSDAKGETANKPTCIVCLGMAGSGKTTFMQVSILHLLIVGLCYFYFQRISAHLYSKNCPPYCINLDPAVNQVPFPANIGVCMCVSVYI